MAVYLRLLRVLVAFLGLLVLIPQATVFAASPPPWRPSTRDEIEISRAVHRHRYVRGQLSITPHDGITYPVLSEYLEQFGGQIIGISHNQRTYQVYFPYDAHRIAGIIIQGSRSAVISHIGRNYVQGIPDLLPEQIADLIAHPENHEYELISTPLWSGWLVESIQQFNPVVLTFDNSAELDEFITDPAFKDMREHRENHLSHFCDNFFENYVLMLIATRDSRSIPFTYLDGIIATEDLLTVNIFTSNYLWRGSHSRWDNVFIIAVNRKAFRNHMQIVHTRIYSATTRPPPIYHDFFFDWWVPPPVNFEHTAFSQPVPLYIIAVLLIAALSFGLYFWAIHKITEQ
jgi:hypothetical protein